MITTPWRFLQSPLFPYFARTREFHFTLRRSYRLISAGTICAAKAGHGLTSDLLLLIPLMATNIALSRLAGYYELARRYGANSRAIRACAGPMPLHKIYMLGNRAA